MEELTGIPAESILGKGDYEYALPFYGERKPMLANLILLPDPEIERRYHTLVRRGDTLVVDIFLPDFRPGAFSCGPRPAPSGMERERSSEPLSRSGHYRAETG
jgi:hypothetical protein